MLRSNQNDAWPSCAESQVAENAWHLRGCLCSSHAKVDRQPGYHGIAMGTAAVLFLWMAGWVNSRQLQVIDSCATRTVSSASSSAGGACGSP